VVAVRGGGVPLQWRAVAVARAVAPSVARRSRARDERRRSERRGWGGV